MVGADAVELGEVDRELAELLHRRAELLDRLGARRAAGPTMTETAPAVETGPAVEAGPAVETVPGAGPPFAPSTATPTLRGPLLGGQQLLLALGALLVLSASMVFLAVNWSLLGPAGQLSVAVAAAGLCAGLSGWTMRHQLRSSAEAFAMLSVLLLVATGIGARVLELFGDLDGALFAAIATALLAALCVGASRLVDVTAYRIGAIVSAQFVLPAAAVALDGNPPVVLAAIAAGGLATVALVADWQPMTVRLTAALSWVIVAVVGTVEIWVHDDAMAHGAVVVATSVASALLTRHPLRLFGWPLAAIASVSVLYEVVGPWPGGLAATVLVAAALADRDVRVAPLHYAATGGVAVAALASGLADDPGVFALAGCTLWVLAARHVNRVALALAPATVLAVSSLAVAADVGVATGLAAVAVGVAAVWVAVLELPRVVQVDARPPAIAGVVACFAGVWLVGIAALSEPDTAQVVVLQRANAVGFAAGALAAGWTMWRWPSRWLSLPAAALASIAGWWLLASRSVDTVEWYSLGAAAWFALAGLVPLRRDNSFAALGPATVLALWPTSVVAVLDNDLLRLLLAVVAAAAVAVLAVQARRAAPLYGSAVALAWLVIGQLENWSAYVPRWAVLATIGALLLAAGVSFEASRKAARSMFGFLRSLR